MKINNWTKRKTAWIPIAGVLAVILMAIPSYAGYIVDPDAYWQLNETTSPFSETIGGYVNPLYDADALCNDAISSGCPSQQNPGRVGQALNFDSSMDELYVPSDATGNAPFDWQNDESFSIEFWMRRAGDNLIGYEAIIARDDGIDNDGGMYLLVGITPDGKAIFDLRDINTANDPNYSRILSETVVVDGEWHHIVAIRDADNQEVRLYVDGVAESLDSTVELGTILNPNIPLTIGYLSNHNGNRLHFGNGAAQGGDLDELALYSSVLSAEAIKQHYLNGQESKGLGQTFAPVMKTTPPAAAAVGYTYAYDADAAGNPMPAYSLSAGPDTMIMEDSQTGEISWVPFFTDAGPDYPFTVTATNSVSSFNQNATVSVYDVCNGYMDAYWDFNNAGDRFADSAGDNDGGCTNNCPIVLNAPDSVAGAAMQFNGATTWFDVENDPVGTDVFDWGSNDSFSIEFWLRRPDTIVSNEVIVGRDDGDADRGTGLHWWVGLNGSGQVRFLLRDQYDNQKEILGENVVADGQWHHVVAIRDKQNEELLLYVDGRPDPIDPIATSNTDFVVGFPAPLRPLNIGYLGTDGAGDNYFGGDLDEIALYNFALPEGIIKQHYVYSEEIGRGYCNTAPIITGPAFINGTEDTPLTIALGDLAVTDPDNTYPVEHTLTLQAGDNYTVEGNTITPAKDYNGALSVPTVVSDPYHDSNPFNLTVDIGAVNDPPVVDDIPDQQIQAGGNFQPIPLDDYVSDVDTDVNLLRWSYSGNTGLIVSISSNRIATVTVPDAAWTGSETITFRAEDPVTSLLYDEDSATFTVSTTAAPVVSNIPDQSIKAGESFTVINLDSYVADDDTADDQLTWTVSGATNLAVDIDDATRVATVTASDAEWTGSETITFRATDPNGNFDEDVATFTIEGDGGGGGGGSCFISISRPDPENPIGGFNLIYLLGLVFLTTASVAVLKKTIDKK